MRFPIRRGPRRGGAQLQIRLGGGIDAATSYMRASAYTSQRQQLPAARDAVVIFLHDFFDSPTSTPTCCSQTSGPGSPSRSDRLRQSGHAVPGQARIRTRSAPAARCWTNCCGNIRAATARDRVSNANLAESGMLCGVTVYGTVAHELAYFGFRRLPARGIHTILSIFAGRPVRRGIRGDACDPGRCRWSRRPCAGRRWPSTTCTTCTAAKPSGAARGLRRLLAGLQSAAGAGRPAVVHELAGGAGARAGPPAPPADSRGRRHRSQPGVDPCPISSNLATSMTESYAQHPLFRAPTASLHLDDDCWPASTTPTHCWRATAAASAPVSTRPPWRNAWPRWTGSSSRCARRPRIPASANSCVNCRSNAGGSRGSGSSSPDRNRAGLRR